MRTVIFFGLMCIADAIGKQTGWAPTQTVAPIGAVIFLVAVVLDFIDAFRG